MTENEAISAIQNDLEWHSKELKPAYKEVLRMAIQALEEIQQYRAIGTVEELQKKMEELERWHTDRINENIMNPFAYTSTSICHNCDHKDEYIEELEAEIKSLKENGAFSGIELAQIASMQMKLKEYQSIGTIDEFKALKEKSVAKKPIYKFEYENGTQFYDCPKCKRYVMHSGVQSKEKYCSNCGIKLDWSE